MCSSDLIFEENDSDNDPYEMDVTFTLVADPDFEGDVVLTLSGDAMEEQEVTIAKFVKPYTVSAQQNDLTMITEIQKFLPTLLSQKQKLVCGKKALNLL